MITYQIKAGTTDVSVVIRIVDSADGTPETGVVFNTSGIDLEYRREGAATTDITEATLAALTTAHADGGFLHIGNGYYRLDLPDAACASGVPGVLVHGTVTGMVVIGCYIQLPVNTAEDIYARVGAPAGASVSADVAAVKVDTAAILVDTGTTLDGRIPAALVGGRMDASVGAMAANTMTAAAAAADLTTELQSGLATSSALSTLQTSVNTVDDLLDTEVGAIKTVVDAIQAKTDNLPTDPADQSLIIAATNTILADTNAILIDTAEIGAAGAGLTALATQASVNDLPTNAELATALGTADDAVLAQVALVKAKTDQLTFTVANQLDANTKSLNDVTVIGAGTALDKWRA